MIGRGPLGRPWPTEAFSVHILLQISVVRFEHSRVRPETFQRSGLRGGPSAFCEEMGKERLPEVALWEILSWVFSSNVKAPNSRVHGELVFLLSFSIS